VDERELHALSFAKKAVAARLLEFFMAERARPDEALIEILASVGVQLGRVLERERAQASLETQARTIEGLAITDELTGLLNRGGFISHADQQVKVSRRRKERCALFFADMDGLKRVNDQLGHAAGDAALQEVAVVPRRRFREADLVARLGGDEFVVLAQTEDDGAPAALIERVQENLRGRFAAEDPAYPLAVSIGVRWVPPGNTTRVEDLLVEADRARCEAKKKRRAERVRRVGPASRPARCDASPAGTAGRPA
jgi:diguanylate cyclase (GGDEF)-like protein